MSGSIEDRSVLSYHSISQKIHLGTDVYFSAVTCHLTTTGNENSEPPADFITYITYLFDNPIPDVFFPKALKNLTLSHHHQPLPVACHLKQFGYSFLRNLSQSRNLNNGDISSAIIGQVHPGCENMFVNGSIPPSVKNLIKAILSMLWTAV
ncbi:hypothetical protein CYY_000232 [Polysphondylium violaceum]|uniref:Uncharacterized protein n=1 Tax=Polysphondylium violaceum TaxID=133409 RepID=A0A8J4V972_9MYCE|nr:hypothetical protein CYY_000232 [Polysphondylium violaceum]